MRATALPPGLLAAAPDISVRLGLILAGLAALIARAFLRDPRHVTVIVPLWNYIGRTSRRFARVMERLAAGTLRPARARLPRALRPAPLRPAAVPVHGLGFPRRRGWLVAALRHEAAAYGSQLRHLLAQPDAAALIAATPQAQRLLRPLCHMLGIAPEALQKPAAPAREPEGGGTDAAPPGPPHPAPHPPRPRLARQPPTRPPAPPDFGSLCPRLRDRWPFNQLRRPAGA